MSISLTHLRPSPRSAYWNFSGSVGSWVPVPGVNAGGVVRALAWSRNSERVWVGGDFVAGPATNIGRWSSAGGWSQPMALSGSVFSLAVLGSKVYVGGDFVGRAVRWDDDTTSSTSVTGGSVNLATILVRAFPRAAQWD